MAPSAGCKAEQDAVPPPAKAPVAAAPQPPVQDFEHSGEEMPAYVHAEFSTTLVTATIENNTASNLTFSSALQFLDIEGADVISPVLGSNMTVNAGTTSTAFTLTYPPLPDGIHQLTITVAATIPGTNQEVSSGTSGYIEIVGGVKTMLSFGQWNNKTGGGPIAPLIE